LEVWCIFRRKRGSTAINGYIAVVVAAAAAGAWMASDKDDDVAICVGKKTRRALRDKRYLDRTTALIAPPRNNLTYCLL